MTSVVVTSCSEGGWRLYGRRMVDSVIRYWPSAQLVLYADVPRVVPQLDVRATSALTTWVACRRRWAQDLSVQGRSTPEVPRTKPYSYRWDANRFAIKPFVQFDAAQRLGRGILTWLDADTVATRRVPEGWAEALLAEADVAFLGRGRMHPETGYVGFRLPEALPVLAWCCDCYASERFRAIQGWTDCHILRAALEAVPVRAKNLTADAYVGKSHIWPASPLAPYLTHFKGAQKRQAVAC